MWLGQRLFIEMIWYYKMTSEINTKEIAAKARDAKAIMACLSESEKNRVLDGFKKNLLLNKKKILEANQIDLLNAEKKELSQAFIDRLKLNAERVQAMADSISEIINLPDPVGQVSSEWERPNGLKIKRVQTPIGVIAIIYESRPNVTVDASALSFKSGNPCILRCGADSINSCNEIFRSIEQSIADIGLPKSCIQFINNSDRQLVKEILSLSEYIDVVIPRGGKDLVSLIEAESRIPTFSHLEGIVHIFVDKDADPVKAFDVILNSKIRRVGICGAVECLLIDESFFKNNDLTFISSLMEKGVEVRGDKHISSRFNTVLASDEDWGKEYLDNIIACRVVEGLDEAIHHIDKFGSGHTDCIISENDKAVESFFGRLDSAILLHNASTQFADGGEFGLGAEIGISTGKLHARGPIGLNQLTTFQYHVIGKGTTRA